MSKYHINAKGEPGLCRAEKNCPFGDSDHHFSTAEDARKAYEITMAGGPWNGNPSVKRASEVRLRELRDLVETAHSNWDRYTRKGTGYEAEASLWQAASIEAEKILSAAQVGNDSGRTAKDVVGETQDKIAEAHRASYAEENLPATVLRGEAANKAARHHARVERQILNGKLAAYDLAVSQRRLPNYNPNASVEAKSAARSYTAYDAANMPTSLEGYSTHQLRGLLSYEVDSQSTVTKAVVAELDARMIPANRLSVGTTHYDNAIIGFVHVPIDSDDLPSATEKSQGFIVKEVVIPNAGRWSEKRKLALSKELWKLAGKDPTAWEKLTSNQKFQLVKTNAGRYQDVSFDVSADGHYYYRSKTSSGYNHKTSNLTILEVD